MHEQRRLATQSYEAQYVARQAIFSVDREVVAYELLYRDSPINAFPFQLEDSIATGRMFFDVILLQGLEKVSDGQIAFINLATDALLESLPELIPPDNVVIEIVERSRSIESLERIIKSLKSKGYCFALDDYDSAPKWEPLLKLVDYIKIEVEPSLADTVTLVKHLKSRFPDTQLIVERVETHEQADAIINAGADLLQGFFFSLPLMLEYKNISPCKRTIMNLLSETLNPELDFKNITKLLSVDVSLTARILKMANNFGGAHAAISSLQQAVTYIGEDHLRRFIRVLALGELGTDKPTELTKLGLMRAHFIASVVSPAGKSFIEQGYLLGLLSVLDAVLDVPIDALAKEFSLSGELSSALLDANGMLGHALGAAYACELCQWPLAEEILQTIRPASDKKVLYDALTEARTYCDETMHLLSKE
ncbi:EAL and HDOD domain-containing protein [Pseudoalteromonas sp. SSDWG2]|uniref:EAL and HDOD domain-containing protein n=1 Tax=Pseudoalteromonas sp. SSDWG2 TaxID=3139391 RepID=UPI003BABAB4E